MRSKGLVTIIFMVALLFATKVSRAAQRENEPPNPYTIKVGVSLAVLPVTVLDHNKHHVAGLKKDNFQVYEDGRRQEISLFEDKDSPVTVGFVVDNSLSMQPRRAAVVAAAVAFAESSNPRDEIFVVNFNQSVHLELPNGVPFTRSPQELRAALSRFNTSGQTALYDAIAVALEHLKEGREGRKYLIVVSDGGDDASHHSKSQILALAKKSNAAIYSVGILNENFTGENPGILMKLSHVTGGEYYSPETVPAVIDSLKVIAHDIRQQYTLGYVPSNQVEDGKFHNVKVTVAASGNESLTVRTRTGYLAAPSEPTPEAHLLEDPARK